jgi:hypothetical protein
VKQAVSLIAGAVLLVGCGREPQKPEADAPSAKAAPVAAVPSQVNPVAKPAMPVKPELPRVAQAAPVPVTPVPVIGNHGIPFSTAIFLQAPHPGTLDPESNAARAVAQAQDLFRQGETNAAVEVLKKAVKDPTCETGRPWLVQMLVAALLASGRVEDAEATCIEYATDQNPKLYCGSVVTRYLIEEKGDAESALAWTARLEKLELGGAPAELILRDRLMSLEAAGRIDEIVERVPEIVAYTNEAQNMRIMLSVANDMIARSHFDNAERFLASIEAAAGEGKAYSGMVSGLRKRLESVRAESASPAPGK